MKHVIKLRYDCPCGEGETLLGYINLDDFMLATAINKAAALERAIRDCVEKMIPEIIEHNERPK
jgi:hypothetical protein